MTPEQEKRRKQMLEAHYNDDTHDYRSPKEWQKQVFRLEVKKTLFHIAINLVLAAAIVGGIVLFMKYK